MVETKAKFTPPTWEETNSEKNFVEGRGYTQELAKLRVEQNNKLKDFLVKNGWGFWEGVDSYENGYTIGMNKPTGIISGKEGRPYCHPYLRFEWHWYHCGGPEFFRGKMYTFYNYSPDYKFLNPWATFEINDILECNLKNLRDYEGSLKCALLSQNPIENGNGQNRPYQI